MIKDFICDVQSQITKLRGVLTKDSSVLLLTHASCLDGTTCQMLMQSVLPQTVVVKLSPTKVDEYVSSLTTNAFDVIIIADISTRNTDFLLKDNVIMVDHHDSALAFNDPSTLTFVNNSACGSKLLWLMLQMIFKTELKYSDFIEVVNDHDLWILKDERSRLLNALMYELGDSKFIERFKSFKLKLTDADVSWFNTRIAKVKADATNMQIEDLGYGVGLYFDNEYNNDLMHEILQIREYHTILTYKPKFGGVSVRTKHESLHLGEILSDASIGGGHRHAGGFRSKTQEEFLKSLKKFMKEVEAILEPPVF